jgi:uncharacterized protein YjbK
MTLALAAFDLSHLPDSIDKVEFKGTVIDGDLAAVEAMLAGQGVQPVDGAVYFYDTKALALFDQDVLLRARILGDEAESTVKLRPAAAAVAAAAKAGNEKVKVELDIAGAKQSLSAKLDKKRDPGEIDAVAGTPGTVPALFSDKQRDLIELHAPGAPALDVLRVLGPVDVRKWELAPTPAFPYELAAEKWTLDDAKQFIELSIKVDPADAAKAQADFLGLLDDQQLHVTNEQKTPLVLRFFAARLADQVTA